MKRSVQLVRLGIALISFANATAALGVPGTLPAACASTPLAVETASHRRVDLKVQRPPRVPRRERFEGDRTEALAAGSDA